MYSPITHICCEVLIEDLRNFQLKFAKMIFGTISLFI